MVNHHLAKVYGQAEVGAPPMSVPPSTLVLSTANAWCCLGRSRPSQPALKNGSLWDLLASTNTSNIMPMLNVGLDNFDLVKYLISQVLQKDKDRHAALCEYYPEARKEDWRLWQAGQRVQIIKRDEKKAAFCVWVPKSSAMMKVPLPRCWAPRRGFHCGANHAATDGESVQRED